MPRESAIPIDLPSLDDLFTTQAERDEVGCEKVGVIPLYMIDPFPDHPFRVDDDALRDMAESVSRFGVLVPALVRPKENGRYEMVSGHRRKRAAEMAGLEALPAVVREMTYDEAVIAMVDANIQRENVLPSEKAFAYKMKIDALSRQGYRSDLTCAPVGHKLANARSRDIVAEQSGESKSQVQRYVRLTHLNPDLLDMVDGGSMAMRPPWRSAICPKGSRTTCSTPWGWRRARRPTPRRSGCAGSRSRARCREKPWRPSWASANPTRWNSSASPARR